MLWLVKAEFGEAGHAGHAQERLLRLVEATGAAAHLCWGQHVLATADVGRQADRNAHDRDMNRKIWWALMVWPQNLVHREKG